MQITIKVRSSHFLMLYVVYINRIAPSFRSRRYFSHHSKGCFLYLTAHRSRGRQTALVNSYRRFIMPLVRGQTNYICPLTCTIRRTSALNSSAPCASCSKLRKVFRCAKRYYFLQYRFTIVLSLFIITILMCLFRLLE